MVFDFNNPSLSASFVIWENISRFSGVYHCPQYTVWCILLVCFQGIQSQILVVDRHFRVCERLCGRETKIEKAVSSFNSFILRLGHINNTSNAVSCNPNWLCGKSTVRDPEAVRSQNESMWSNRKIPGFKSGSQIYGWESASSLSWDLIIPALVDSL